MALEHVGVLRRRELELGGGKLTTLKGGVPVVVDGQVVGAVGVGGGTGEQDADVARAGIKKLLDALEK